MVETNGTLTPDGTADLTRATPATERALPNPDTVARSLVGAGAGRQTMDDPNGLGPFGTMRAIRAPRDPRTEWTWSDLDARTFEKISPQRLLELLSDLSPETSDGIWILLRLCCNEWTIAAYQRNADGTRGDPHDEAKQTIDRFIDRLTDRHGAPEVVWAMMYFAALLRGAFFVELILDGTGREMIDLATPDPASARFRLTEDPTLGQVWQLGQWQGRKGFVDLTSPLVRHVPIDPFPGDAPYGRPVIAPVAFVALFALGLMHDLRRVVSQQGYPRHNIQILLEELKKEMPADAAADPNKFFLWAETLTNRVKAIYEALGPADAFVHTTAVGLDLLKGAADSGGLSGIDAIIQWLERMLARAMKVMPLLLGVGGGTSEANANRQYEIQAQGVKSLQQLAERCIERLLELGLQAAGIIADVDVTFEENRVAEAQRDQQVRTLQILNAFREYLIGGNFEVLCATLGITPADGVTEPLAMLAGTAAAAGGMGGGQQAAEQQNPDEGSNREEPEALGELRRRLDIIRADHLSPAGRPLPALPPRALSERDAEMILEAFDAIMPREYDGMLEAELEGAGSAR